MNIWDVEVGEECPRGTLVDVKDIETVLISTEKDCKIIKKEILDKYKPKISLDTLSDLGMQYAKQFSFDSISLRLRDEEKGLTARLICKSSEKWYLIENRKN